MTADERDAAPVPHAEVPRRKGMIAWARRLLASSERLLRWSAGMTLVALALMVWSMMVPTPLPVMVAMTVGQALGTLAFGLYGFVIVQDLRRGRRERRDARTSQQRISTDEPAP